MRQGVCSSWLGLCLLPGFAWGQVVVEAPHVNQAMEGIRVYFGYACETAGQPTSPITVGFNGRSATRIASRLDRADTTGVCNDDGFNGFVGFTNFNLFPLGANTFELYQDGVLVATIPFQNAPWSDGTEFIPGPDPTIPALPEGTFDSTAPATEAYVLLSGCPHQGRTVLAHYGLTFQGLGTVSTRAQSYPGITRTDLIPLLGSTGIMITLPTDPLGAIIFPGRNGISDTPLGPTVTNLNGGIFGAFPAVLEDPNFASTASAQSLLFPLALRRTKSALLAPLSVLLGSNAKLRADFLEKSLAFALRENSYVFPKIDTLNTGQSPAFTALGRNTAGSRNPGSVLIYPHC